MSDESLGTIEGIKYVRNEAREIISLEVFVVWSPDVGIGAGRTIPVKFVGVMPSFSAESESK